MAAGATVRAPRRAPARQPAGTGTSKAGLRVIAGRPRRPGPRRPTVLLGVGIVLGSLLAVVGVQAYLVQGQVDLSNLQQTLTTQLTDHRALELRVAQLENPTSIIAEARNDGMVEPSQVSDVPQVTVTAPSAHPTGAGTGGTSAHSVPTSAARTGRSRGASRDLGSGQARLTPSGPGR